jgi:hypothetical protein
MHDAAKFYDFMCGEIHSACSECGLPPVPRREDECPPGGDCVAHNIFGFEVEKRLSCTSCRTQSRVERYILWSHLASAHGLRGTVCRFKRNLANVYTVPIECRMDDGGCGVKGVEMEELLTAPEIFIISEPPSFISHKSTIWGIDPYSLVCNARSHIRIYLLADLTWASDQEDPISVIQPAIDAIKLTLDVAGIYPIHRMKVVPKYSLKAVITFYGQHYVSYVHAKGDWTRYDDHDATRLKNWTAAKDNMISGHQQPTVLVYGKVCRREPEMAALFRV